MEKLFTPDVGLMVWTVVTFALLLGILGRFGWGPMIVAIEQREGRLREERQAAEAARAEAQRIQADLEGKLADLDRRSREILAAAAKEADALRAQNAAQAQAQAKQILGDARIELEEEKQRLVRDLRKEVAALSVLAAEKLLRKTVDESIQKNVLESFFKDLDAKRIN